MPTDKTCIEPYCRNEVVPGQTICKKHLQMKIDGAKPPPCSVEGCPRAAFVKGLCHGHYRRQLRGGDVNSPLRKMDQSLLTLPGPSVRPEVHSLMEKVAKAQGVSLFIFQRNHWDEWYAQTTGTRIPD